jgi:TfoX/Sxy family transcriptional regulator of competence genes
MADRVRELIAAEAKNVEEKRMFSGLCFMVNDKMCVAVRPDSIMVRLDPTRSEEVLDKEGVLPMIHSGKIMQGFVFVNDEVLTTKRQLEYWVGMALDFNKFAKSSKTKKTVKGKPEAKKTPGVKKKTAAAKEKSPAAGKKVSAAVRGKKAVSKVRVPAAKGKSGKKRSA